MRLRNVSQTSLLIILAFSFTIFSCGEKKAEFSGEAKIRETKQNNTEDAVAKPIAKPVAAEAAETEKDTSIPQYITKLFSLTEVQTELVVKNQENGNQSTSIQMTEDTTPEVQNFFQNSRESINDQHTQGLSGDSHTQTFNQVDAGLVDLLVVVDVSSSMSEEQTKLSTKMSPLISAFENSNWRIGVITTDEFWRTTITKGDSAASTKFQYAVYAGTGINKKEEGVRNAIAGLNKEGFLRDGSKLAILFISDEDNCSTGSSSPECNSAVLDQPITLKNHITNTLGRELGTDARMYGIIAYPACATSYNVSYEYKSLVDDSQGTYGSICDDDYTPTLNAIESP
jgi:hypothetical protein